LGDIHYRVKAYAQAIAAYEQSLLLVPENAEVLNNLAWLLLTCEDARFIDDDRGLLLASKAVRLKSSPHILDTLAHAYWLKGEKEMALEIEKRALATARPDQKKIYDDQLKKWQEMAGNTSGPGLEF
jgi:tetratricopeptide (TPR) repeat protein